MLGMIRLSALRPAARAGDTSRLHLQRLFVLRTVSIGAQLLAIGVAAWQFGVSLPLIPVAAIVGMLALLNALTWWRLRRARSVGELELFAQLLVDVIALTALLYLTGGWANPFVSLYLLPLVIAATVLPPRYAWAMAAITVACYSGLGWLYVPLPHAHPAAAQDFDAHLIGMWASFVLSAGVVAWLVVEMAQSLRRRDRALAAAREKALRDDQVLALGTMAAAAAHRLGTPLATMAVLAGELKESVQADPAAVRDLDTLRVQLDHCKQIIADLAASAGQARAESGSALPVDEFVRRTLEGWQALRPEVDVRCDIGGEGPAPRIVSERSLANTLISLLDNAADASPDGIEFDTRWTCEQLVVEIRDRGEGLPPGAQDALGRTVYSAKPGGHGIGLLLANAAIERFGGRVTLAGRASGGTRTRVELPLSALAAA
jgi:two-component system sensor histidine kinase RegB